MGGKRHIINKVVVVVNTTRLDIATKMKDDLPELLKESLFPVIEKKLDKYSQPGKVVRFDRLELQLTLSSKTYHQTLVTEVGDLFSRLIEKGVTNAEQPLLQQESIRDDPFQPSPVLIPQKEHLGSQFLYFLENGYLPWHGNREGLSSFMLPDQWEEALKGDRFTQQLTRLLKQDERIIHRFIYQLGDRQLALFTRAINSPIHQASLTLLDALPRLTRDSRNALLLFLISTALEKEEGRLVQEVEKLTESIQSRMSSRSITERQLLITDLIINNRLLNKNEKQIEAKMTIGEKSQETRERNNDNEEPAITENAIWIQNAGLILLHPFLKPFFKEMRLTDDKGHLKSDAHQKAIQAVHFLATSNREFFEANMVFEKFLCGLPLDEPVEKECLLTEKDKSECIVLLQQVIHHWHALKNSSSEWLQQLFLQRKGKLIVSDKQVKLMIERQSQDVLLEKLDWNISVVKIPWIDKLIYVEW